MIQPQFTATQKAVGTIAAVGMLVLAAEVINNIYVGVTELNKCEKHHRHYELTYEGSRSLPLIFPLGFMSKCTERVIHT